MLYKVSVDFTVEASSPEEVKVNLNEFLLRAITEWRLMHCKVKDYEFPYGYPEEPISNIGRGNDHTQQGKSV